MDSYPFAAAPFMPKELSEEFLRQVGGTVYLNFTKFGHWSNPLAGGPRLVNVCVAPNGQAVGHGSYDYWEPTKELETLEMSGAPRETVKAFVEKIGACGYLTNMMEDIRAPELAGEKFPLAAPFSRN
jgi:hypothetical protein